MLCLFWKFTRPCKTLKKELPLNYINTLWHWLFDFRTIGSLTCLVQFFTNSARPGADSGGGAPGARPSPPKKKKRERGEERGSKEETIRSIRGKTGVTKTRNGKRNGMENGMKRKICNVIYVYLRKTYIHYLSIFVWITRLFDWQCRFTIY